MSFDLKGNLKRKWHRKGERVPQTYTIKVCGVKKQNFQYMIGHPHTT